MNATRRSGGGGGWWCACRKEKEEIPGFYVASERSSGHLGLACHMPPSLALHDAYLRARSAAFAKVPSRQLVEGAWRERCSAGRFPRPLQVRGFP